MRRSHGFLATALACIATSSFAAVPKLGVNIKGVLPNEGPVVVAVYKDSDTWLKLDKALQTAKVAPGSQTVTVAFDLPPGSYAVAIFQDKNTNNKLDMQWLPPGPAEPWVMSRDAKGTMGPPAFSDAKFDFAGEQTLALTLNEP